MTEQGRGTFGKKGTVGTMPAVAGLDLRSLPLPAAILAMRAWAEGCLAVLASDPEQAQPVAADVLLELEPLLLPWFGSPTEPERLQRRARRAFRSLSLRLQQPLSLTLARNLGRRRFGLLPAAVPVRRPTPLHAALWAPLAEMAWGAPQLRYTVARELRAHLRTRVLFASGDLPTVSLDGRVFWMLIDLLGVPQLRSRRRIERKLKRKLPLRSVPPLYLRIGRTVLRQLYGIRWRGSRHQVAKRLAAVAQEQVAGTPWAGFWDQWFIGEVVRRQQQLLRFASPRSLRFLAALPWLVEAPYQTELAELLGPFQKDGHAAVLTNIADPAWCQQQPDWIR